MKRFIVLTSLFLATVICGCALSQSVATTGPPHTTIADTGWPARSSASG